MLNRDLPKGVYALANGRFKSYIWEAITGKLTYIGTFATVEDALLARLNKLKGHHWRGLEPDDSNYGFIYSIVNIRTNEMYIGRKVYKGYDKVIGTRCLPSNWEYYETGSLNVQKWFKEEPENLKCNILMNTEGNPVASFAENYLILKIILLKLPNGKPYCMNRMVPKLFFNDLVNLDILKLRKDLDLIIKDLVGVSL